MRWGWGRIVAALAVLIGASDTAHATPLLTAVDATRIISQAVAEARALDLPVNVAVVDAEGNILATHTMHDAPDFTVLRGGGPERCQPPLPPDNCGLEGVRVLPLNVPGLNGAILAAISKAGTGAFLSSSGHAFTTRTAGFIIQQHFPPEVSNTPGGPLFGVQFSQLPCGDVIARAGQSYPKPLLPLPAGTLPLGLSADPGGLPLYKGAHLVGGVGIEGNEVYTIDRAAAATATPTREEQIAVAATRGFEAPAAIRATQILVGGLRFPFAAVERVRARRLAVIESAKTDVLPRDAPPSRFRRQRLGGVSGLVDPRFFPAVDGIDPAPAIAGLTATEVTRLLTQAVRRAHRLRAAIRRPLGDYARVSVSVVDAGGHMLGLFRMRGAAIFGVDVSAQKARTAAFFSRPDAGLLLRAGDAIRRSDILTQFVDAAAGEGIALDGSIAFSDRAQGFLTRPFFPDGIDATRPGPFSRQSKDFTVFNDGLQVELALPALQRILTKQPTPDCTTGTVFGLANGLQIFAGSVPLYRGRELVGAIGVSGDGIDQDDAVAAAGSRGFGAPSDLRADRVRVRGVRLPYVKLPRRPETR